MKIYELKNKKIAILGFWMEWKSTKSFLEKLWIHDFEILDKSISKDYLDNLDRFDLIFKSPWISPYNLPELSKVKEKLISQSEILADNFSGKIIWVTWTKWKSTISTLIYETLKQMGYKVKLIWNIWKPLFDEIDLIDKKESYDFIVYELSSYMLEWLNLNIFIGLLNNIYDCHLDWHNWRDNYKRAKFNIFKYAKYKLIWNELFDSINDKNDKMFFGLDWKYSYKNNCFYIDDKEIIKDENIFLNWIHNKKNIAWLIWVLDIIDSNFDIEKLKNVLTNFKWLPHRQENIWTYKGITFINDSIASNPEAAIAAINIFANKIWTIFIWNEDSGFNLTKLKETIKKFNIKNIVLFPSTWEKLFWDFSKNMKFDLEYDFEEDEFKTKLYKTLSMESAIKFAYNNTKSWEIVLLSTWAPSFNASWTWVMPWKSYIEKWDLFKKYAAKYK